MYKILAIISLFTIMVSVTQTAHAYEKLPPIDLSQHPEINQDWYDNKNLVLNPSVVNCFNLSLLPFVGHGAIQPCLDGIHKVQDVLCSNPEVYQKIDVCKHGKIQTYLDTFENTSLDNSTTQTTNP